MNIFEFALEAQYVFISTKWEICKPKVPVKKIRKTKSMKIVICNCRLTDVSYLAIILFQCQGFFVLFCLFFHNVSIQLTLRRECFHFNLIKLLPCIRNMNL